MKPKSVYDQIWPDMDVELEDGATSISQLFYKDGFRIEDGVLSCNGIRFLKLEGDWSIEITSDDEIVYHCDYKPNMTYRAEWAFAVLLMFLIVLVIWSL